MIEKHLLNTVTAEIVTWLDCTDFNRSLEVVQQWDEATWQAAKRAALMQGIGAYLSQVLPKTPLYPHLPGWFQAWLDETYTLNSKRIARLHADLQRLLCESNRVGIPVMPLKGSLLTNQLYSSTAIRPMSDLDLLIRPTDRKKMGQLLEELGYTLVPPKSKRWFHHDLYLNGTGDTVVSMDEHPDNPRPVEIHLNLESEIWACFSTPELTNNLWETSDEKTLFGEPVYLPSTTSHLTFIATHHLRHLLFGSGRAIQLLDLALLANDVPDLTAIPHLELLYLVFRLAGRVFPSHFTKVNWDKLAQNVHPRVRTWAETTPLDARCGLQMSTQKYGASRWRLRWIRWHPTPLRLTLIYGDTPLPVAYLRFSNTALGNILGR